MNKTLVLGVSGGIAAYKAAELTRLLTKAEYTVHCVLTEHAKKFIGPITFATLSGNPVLSGNFEASESGKIQHITLSEIADLILVAPATANIIGKIAHGIADDLLTTLVLASQKQVAVCPAMNLFMWENPATQENIQILQNRGIEIIGPVSGNLACGYEGMGRMEEPEKILEEIHALLVNHRIFSDKKILITAGPTQEPFDPIRFLSNPSSGKMGYALAKAALQFGAKVTLISGPVNLQPPYGAAIIKVKTADEMFAAAEQKFLESDIFISAAAVSDWKPSLFHSEKEKKSGSSKILELVPTPDILALLSRRKKNQILIGFAAETENLEKNALKKLQEKNLDLVVGNLIHWDGKSPFGADENEITLFYKTKLSKSLPRMSKLKIAQIILKEVEQLLINPER
jgi:phosphopantothenoylcysteine decarboxylase/phosphopantothenate--cysteine ligase